MARETKNIDEAYSIAVGALEIALEELGKWKMCEDKNGGDEDLNYAVKEAKRAIKIKVAKQFPNGFDDWQEAHFEMVEAITESRYNDGSVANQRMEQQGTGGLYLLALELTNKFETENKGKQWGIDEDTQYFDAIEKFIEENL